MKHLPEVQVGLIELCKVGKVTCILTQTGKMSLMGVIVNDPLTCFHKY
jgi:hypothetical protein